jgi:hypothetical protein
MQGLPVDERTNMTKESEHDALIQRLRLAQQIVERAQLHDALRPAAFAAVLQALDGQGAGAADRGVELDDHAERNHRRSHHQPNVNGLSKRLAAVAEAFRVDPTVVNQVFAEDGDELLFVLPSRRLTNTTRGAMRQIAILVACARQAGGWDDAWTSSATLRTACESAQVYSSKHFNTVVGGLDMFAVRGAGSNRQLRAHATSYAAARTVLVQLGLLDEEVTA